jgi:hypothetical protein
MFRITRDPSSGSSIQCLAKFTVMVLSILSVDIDVVGVMSAYLQICCNFKYFIIIPIISKNLCICWIIRCFNRQ